MAATRDGINASSFGEANDILAAHASRLAAIEAFDNGGSPSAFAKTYGVVADSQTLGDGAITSGLAALTSATGLFVAGDVGKTVIVAGAGVAGDDLRTTISAYVSATQVTLAATAGGTVAGATFSWGTDNKTAIDAALAALTPTVIGGRQSGGDTLDLGPGQILTSGGHTWPLNVQIIGHGEQATNLIHTGNNSCFKQTGASLVNYGKVGMRHLTIWGNGGASAVGVEFQGKQWEPYLDKTVMIGNYSAGIGVLLNNLAAGAFVEGVAMDATLRYNLVGVEIRRTSGNASFAYQRWLDFNIHVPVGGIGILIGDDAKSSALCQVYSGVFVGNIWIEGDNAVAVKIGAFGSVEANNDWRVKGEIIGSHPTAKALQINTGGKFYPRGIHDFGIDGAISQPTMDVANATTFLPPTRVDETLGVQKLIRESFTRSAVQGSTAPTAGTDVVHLVQFRRGDVVKGITVGVGTNSTGCTLAKVGIWDTAATLLASSADNSANFNAGTAGRLQDTDLSAVWTCPTDGAYYVGIVFVTASATLIRGANLSAAVASGRSGAVLLVAQSAGGKTDIGTFTPSALGTSYWFGAYVV